MQEDNYVMATKVLISATLNVIFLQGQPVTVSFIDELFV